MNKARRILPSHREGVKALIQKGKTYKEIGRRYGVSKQAVWIYVKRNFDDNITYETCLKCKQPITNRRRKTFCSDECRLQWARATRPKPYIKVCIWCSKPFRTDHKTQKYCNRYCMGLSNTKYNARQIAEWYVNGESIKQIAESYNTTVRNIYSALTRKGIKLSDLTAGKTCQICGTSLKGCRPNRKYCDSCTHVGRGKRRRARYREKKRG